MLHTKQQETMTHIPDKKQSEKSSFKGAQMVDLEDKGFKTAILNMGFWTNGSQPTEELTS